MTKRTKQNKKQEEMKQKNQIIKEKIQKIYIYI